MAFIHLGPGPMKVPRRMPQRLPSSQSAIHSKEETQ
jgi:hypothetical protein